MPPNFSKFGKFANVANFVNFANVALPPALCCEAGGARGTRDWRGAAKFYKI